MLLFAPGALQTGAMTSDVKHAARGTHPEDPPAGAFSAWLHRIRRAQVKDGAMDVPCGDCTACCRSSYFIHVGPEETRTLTRIPPELQFPAPGKPEGTVLLGYDENGCCPMLVDAKCSIYAHRPQACRSYDCRIYPAAGIAPGDVDKEQLNERAVSWRFSYPGRRDRDKHEALKAAVVFLSDHPECFAADVTDSATQLALLAIRTYDVFLEHIKTGRQPPADEVVSAVLQATDAFEAKRRGPENRP
tara:strand:- start:3592 stop:4329 length:738 start_codon:yes stop_codon:yes gene_type:complete